MDSDDFYDRLAPDYHLIATDWDEAVRRQGAILDELLSERPGEGALRVLDCSCGIGTQSIGLAMQGHDVFGIDPSVESIERARREAERLVGKEDGPEFRVGDMRELADVDGPFDVVLSMDNAVAHLHGEDDLRRTVYAIKRVLGPEGAVLVGVRDYDALREERPRGTVPRRIKDEHGERIYVQTWEWSEDGRGYDMELFLLSSDDSGWETESADVRMRAYGRDELETAFRGGDFGALESLEPEDTGFYQPILVARRA